MDYVCNGKTSFGSAWLEIVLRGTENSRICASHDESHPQKTKLPALKAENIGESHTVVILAQILADSAENGAIHEC
jgi:hypothetical protein